MIAKKSCDTIPATLGDRYNRKNLLLLSLILEMTGVGLFYCSELISNDPNIIYYFYLLGRGLISIGQASSCTIAPTIVSDMFTDANLRSGRVGIYSVAIVMGGTTSFVVTPLIAREFGYRNVYAFNILTCLILLGFYLKIPNYIRGQGERWVVEQKSVEQKSGKRPAATLTLREIYADFVYLVKIPTFTLITIALFFSTGGVEIGVTFINELYRRQFVWLHKEPMCSEDMVGLSTLVYDTQLDLAEPIFDSCQNLTQRLSELNTGDLPLNYDCQDCVSAEISSVLGIVVSIGALFGALSGTYLYKKFYTTTRKSGCIVGATAGSIATLTFIISYYRGAHFLIQSRTELWVYAIIIFITTNMRVGVLLDSINRVVVPDRRSLSYAIQNFLGMLSGGFAPYLAGTAVDEATRKLLTENFTQNSTLNLLEQNLLFQKVKMLSMFECVAYITFFFAFASSIWVIVGFFWGRDEDRKIDQLKNKN